MRGVLFDLDGTLLDIDLPSFLDRYFRALTGTVASLTGNGEALERAMAAIGQATDAMTRPHPGRTNQQVFFAEFRRLTSIDLTEHSELFSDFYAEVFPTLGDGYGATPDARRAVETALGLGLKVAVATNPIFPRNAVVHRLAWAGLEDIPFDTITTYENMHACKPHPEYFQETAAALGVDTSTCLMVGDDHILDMAAADTGMLTYYVGSHSDTRADYRGDLPGLAALLPRLADTGEE